MSAAETAIGFVPVRRELVANVQPEPDAPQFWFKNTETLWSTELVTARSSFPSLLKSATAIAVGPFLVGTSAAPVNVPSPFPINKVRVLLIWFATTRSMAPSAFRSAATIALGKIPVTGEFAETVKVPSPLPSNRVTEPGVPNPAYGKQVPVPGPQTFMTASSLAPSVLKSAATRCVG